jgi:hydroxymethylglutaryl-CoA lyase
MPGQYPRRPAGVVCGYRGEPMTQTVQIVEVGPRDGLQNESAILSTDRKVKMIGDLANAGLSRIETVSFAHPDRVPQMADAEAIMASLPQREDVSYVGLILNWRGWQRATETSVDEINMNVSASNTFNLKNQASDTDETIEVLGRVVQDASGSGIPVTGTIATSWGCPFEGEVSLDRLLLVAESVAATGVSEIAIADTIGVADPWSVAERVSHVQQVVGDIPLRAHFHNTRNTGIANAYAAIQAGVSTLDSSVGGLGGCPFAPNATGNIATDDLVYMLDRAGLSTGVDLESVIEVSRGLGTLLDHPLEAMLPRAGGFPDNAPDPR